MVVRQLTEKKSRKTFYHPEKNIFAREKNIFAREKNIFAREKNIWLARRGKHGGLLGSLYNVLG